MDWCRVIPEAEAGDWTCASETFLGEEASILVPWALIKMIAAAFICFLYARYCAEAIHYGSPLPAPKTTPVLLSSM